MQNDRRVKPGKSADLPRLAVRSRTEYSLFVENNGLHLFGARKRPRRDSQPPRAHAARRQDRVFRQAATV
jgi:hypothetical protein